MSIEIKINGKNIDEFDTDDVKKALLKSGYKDDIKVIQIDPIRVRFQGSNIQVLFVMLVYDKFTSEYLVCSFIIDEEGEGEYGDGVGEPTEDEDEAGVYYEALLRQLQDRYV